MIFLFDITKIFVDFYKNICYNSLAIRQVGKKGDKMSNIKKYILYTTIYSVGLMFCSGAIIQTFLLQAGFTAQEVYLYNSLIQLRRLP